LAHAQKLGLAQGPEIAWWRVFLSLGLCVILALGGALALKARIAAGSPIFTASGPGQKFRLGLNLDWTRTLGLASSRARGRLALLETLRLTPQVQVCLFSCEERVFALAISAQGQITPLDVADIRPAGDAPK
jgi:hypothetical protein